MKNGMLQILASIVTGLFLFTTLSAQVTNGSFENGGCSGSFTTLGNGSASIQGWLVSGHSVDYICSYWQASDGVRSIDLNGNGAGAVSQTISTVPGWTYLVTFDLSGNPDIRPVRHPFYTPPFKTLSVTVNGLPQFYQFNTANAGNTLANMGWEPNSFSFTAAGSSTVLAFTSLSLGQFGPAIDNVDVGVITQVCHRFETISVDPLDVPAHLVEGDPPGPCPEF